MKIAVYAIAKNEEKHVNRFMDSVKDADEIIIGVDVDSSDNTKELLIECGAKVIDFNVSPFRFDTARNAVLDAIPNDIDVCVSLDMDEVIESGWRDEIEKLWKSDLTRIRYKYVINWQDKDKTKPLKIIHGFRIHRRHNVKWVLPIHEYLELPNGERENEVFAENIVVKHYPDETKERNYLGMIDEALKTESDKPWLWYTRTRQSFNESKFDVAIESAHKFLESTKAYGTYAEQRSECCRLIARAMFTKKQLHKIDDNGQVQLWFLRAVSEWAMQRENWVYLAESWMFLGNLPSAYAAAVNAINCNDRRFSSEVEEICWNDNHLYDIINHCLLKILPPLQEQGLNRQQKRTLERVK